jgi:hypothetical protein
MARLIDADALLDSLRESREGLQKIYDGLHFEIERRLCGAQLTVLVENILRVKSAPTIGAVEIVRCKDCCKRQNPEECLMCFTEVTDIEGGRMYQFRDLTSDDGFCHKGAKMDGKGIAVPTEHETIHRPEECVYYATRQRDGRAVCMGTRELDPCDGAGCKRWKPKKDGGLANG